MAVTKHLDVPGLGTNCLLQPGQEPQSPRSDLLDVVKDAVGSPLDGATELQHDMHLMDRELEEDGPHYDAIEHVTAEPLIHGSEIELVRGEN